MLQAPTEVPQTDQLFLLVQIVALTPRMPCTGLKLTELVLMQAMQPASTPRASSLLLTCKLNKAAT